MAFKKGDRVRVHADMNPDVFVGATVTKVTPHPTNKNAHFYGVKLDHKVIKNKGVNMSVHSDFVYPPVSREAKQAAKQRLASRQNYVKGRRVTNGALPRSKRRA